MYKCWKHDRQGSLLAVSSSSTPPPYPDSFHISDSESELAFARMFLPQPSVLSKPFVAQPRIVHLICWSFLLWSCSPWRLEHIINNEHEDGLMMMVHFLLISFCSSWMRSPRDAPPVCALLDCSPWWCSPCMHFSWSLSLMMLPLYALFLIPLPDDSPQVCAYPDPFPWWSLFLIMKILIRRLETIRYLASCISLSDHALPHVWDIRIMNMKMVWWWLFWCHCIDFVQVLYLVLC